MWDFSTNPQFQEQLDWAREFMRTEIEPLDLLFPDQAFDEVSPALRAHVNALKQRVRD
jgi:acyl-CoA dehydrogenase